MQTPDETLRNSRESILHKAGEVSENVSSSGSSGDVPGASSSGSSGDVPGASSSGSSPVSPDWSTLSIKLGDNLPHWTCESAIYHVSFHLADSIPSATKNFWMREREEIVERAAQQGRFLSEDEEKRLLYLYSEKIARFLDSGYGACHMMNPAVADLIEKAIRHFDGDHYRLHAWCIMPNHVHVIVQPMNEHPIGKIVHSWKSFTASKANEILGNKGQLWQHESYDHIIRSEKEYRFQINYVWENPEKAGFRKWKWRWRSAEF